MKPEYVMRIDDRLTNYMALLNSDLARPANTSVTAAGMRTIIESVRDAVDISSSALQRADEEARRERLNTIRQQLADGSYNISGKDVAEKILNIIKG